MWAALAALLVLIASALPAIAQTKPDLPATDVAGEWQGQWTSPSDYLFTTALTLQVAPDGMASGTFVWVLKRSPLAEEQRKLGLAATEYMSGRFDPVASTLVVAGTRKDDPHDVIFMDRYRLIVSGNGRTMGGLSRNLGDWDGQLFLAR
ncbi:MAG: hypothetical protein Q8M19_06540 [Reyranella sp.]|nr:hypothetical protein [Reyranella sp.]